LAGNLLAAVPTWRQQEWDKYYEFEGRHKRLKDELTLFPAPRSDVGATMRKEMGTAWEALEQMRIWVLNRALEHELRGTRIPDDLRLKFFDQRSSFDKAWQAARIEMLTALQQHQISAADVGIRP
jgi:hypothetical protein